MTEQKVKQSVLLFAHDPGGANTLIPLVQPLQLLGFDILLYGKATALNKYRQAALEGIELKAETPDEIEDFLKSHQPVCLITGTSANDFTEKYLWQAAQQLNIPSLALLDQWINYGVRFSDYGVKDIEKYEQDKTHPFMPDFIGVMDEFAKSEMLDEGIPEERILVTGQPYFETVKQAYKELDTDALKKRFGLLPSEKILLFVSEPLEVSYGNADYLGYTEKTILKSVLDILKEIDARLKHPLSLIVKQHPRENQNGCEELLSGYQFQNIRVLVEAQAPSWDCLKISDWVCGMSSMLLLEAALLGKPILSVQIGLKQTNPLVLCRQGKMASVLDESALLTAFQSALLDDKVETDATFTVPELGLIENPVERIVVWVKALVLLPVRAF